jgi:hypothetical protein
MSLKTKKALKPVKEAFDKSDKAERANILHQVRLVNVIIEEEMKNPKYSKKKKAEIKKESEPFRELQDDLEKEM